MSDLRAAIGRLTERSQLIEIEDNLSSELEISYFTNGVQMKGGPGLLFKMVDGRPSRLLMNAFGSAERVELLLGRGIDEIAAGIERMLGLAERRPGLADGLRLFSDMRSMAVNERGSGPVKEASGDITLDDLPILRTWPGDAGKFITMPVVITRDPEDGSYNLGTYRMQVFDRETTAMHWQTQKGGAMHLKKAERLGRELEVAVVLGAPPVVTFSSISPLPAGMNKLAFAGYLAGKGMDVVRGDTVGLHYPSDAEVVLEGYVDPREVRTEGPFGDHTGYYSEPDLYPVFHIRRITHRRDYIYQATVVGKLWNEDVHISRAIERMFLPGIRFLIPDVVDVFLPEEGLFNDICFVSIRKLYPGQGRKVGMAILSSGQMMFTKYVVVVDDDIDVRDRAQVMWAVATRTDPYRDVEIIKSSVADSLDHASMSPDVGGKMIIDATVKGKEEGYARAWPKRIKFEMDSLMKERLKRHGF